MIDWAAATSSGRVDEQDNGPAVVLRATQVTLGASPARAATEQAMYWTASAVRRVSTKLPSAEPAAMSTDVSK